MKFLLSINNGLAQVKKFSAILRIVNVVVKTIEFAQSEFEKEFSNELKELNNVRESETTNP